MNKLLSITALIAISTLTGVIIATAPPPPPHEVVAVETIQRPPAEYEALVDELNRTRQQHDRKALAYNAKLQASACYKATEILSNNNWAHDNADGTETWVHFDKAGYEYSKAGEVLARGYVEPGDIVNAWINSPTHKDVILGDEYEEFGLCSQSGVLLNSETTVTVAHYGTK